MDNLTEFAKKELERAGLFDKNSYYNGMLGKAILELIKKFAKQSHSGLSANITINLFSELAKFHPIMPLTFEENEWMHFGNEGDKLLFQNKRDCRYFKLGIDGQPYNVEENINKKDGRINKNK